jgi:hypothetical protein
MIAKSRSCAFLALWSLVMMVSGAATGTARAHDIPIHVSLTTNRGCGETAVFRVGDATDYIFSVDRDSTVTLRLQRPDGVIDLLAGVAAQANVVYHVTGVAGSVLGLRTVTVFATAPGASGQAVCTYTVVAIGENRNIGVTLTTNKGCGAESRFRSGETINITFSVDRTSFVVLKLVGPNGTQLLKDNFVATAGVLYPVTVTAGAAGNYTLILDAGAEGRTGHIECAFRVEDRVIAVTLTTDRGCGESAVYRTGDTVTITYSTDRDALVVLKLVGPSGTQLLKDNAVALAGVLNTVTVTAGPAGDYQLILDAAGEGRSGHIECGFRVEAGESRQISVSLTTDKGCGTSAVYRTGDTINITFSTSRDAFVVLKLVGPDGTQLLKDNFVAAAGQTYPVTVTAGAAGGYTLILDAGAEGRTGHIECAFRVDAP